MPPKVVRQWKPSGAKLEANPDVEQLREILNDIRGQPGVEEYRPLHAGSRFDGDSFNDKISALKRKPIQSFDSPKGAQQLISPNGSPLKAIGIFRSAKQKIDNDGFSRHVKIGGASFAVLVVCAIVFVLSGGGGDDGSDWAAHSGEWNPGKFYEVVDHDEASLEEFTSDVRCPAMLTGHGCQERAPVPECVPPIFDSWLTLSQSSADTDHTRTGAPGLVHIPENQWRPYVGSDEHLLPSQDAFGWVPGGPRTIPSCALVANGGILRGLGLGEEIDSHSVVMRINEAPTAGYESDVGQRTTIRLATFQHNQYREKADEVVIGLLSLNCTSSGGRALSECDKQRRRLMNNKVHIVNPDFHSNVAFSPFFKGFLKGTPTSGFVGMVMLLHTCQRVHLFGFNTEETLRLKGNAAFQDWYFKSNTTKRADQTPPNDWPVYTGPLYSTELPNAAKHKGRSGWLFGRRRLRGAEAAAAAQAEESVRVWAGAGLIGGLAGRERRALMQEDDAPKKQAKISRASKSESPVDAGNWKAPKEKKHKPTKEDEKHDKFWAKMTNPFVKTMSSFVGSAPKVHAKDLRAEKHLEKQGGIWAVEAKEKKLKKKLKLKQKLTLDDVDPSEAKQLEAEADQFKSQLSRIMGKGAAASPGAAALAGSNSPASGAGAPPETPAATAAKVTSLLEGDSSETDALDQEGPILDASGNPIPLEDIERVRALRAQFHAMREHMLDELREEGLVQEEPAAAAGAVAGTAEGAGAGAGSAAGPGGAGGAEEGGVDNGEMVELTPKKLTSKQQRALSQQAVVARGEHNCMVALRDSGVVQMSP